jgi:hypothetical protein
MLKFSYGRILNIVARQTRNRPVGHDTNHKIITLSRESRLAGWR